MLGAIGLVLGNAFEILKKVQVFLAGDWIFLIEDANYGDGAARGDTCLSYLI